MINTKQIMLAGAAMLALGIASASAADMSSTTATDTTTSNRPVGAGADASTTVAPEAGSADATVTTKTTTSGKKTMHKKHHMKKPVKKSEVLNSAPGDVKTSNDDSGMSGDVMAHDKAAVSTTDSSSDNQ